MRHLNSFLALVSVVKANWQSIPGQTCGQHKDNPNTLERIVDGTDASLGQFPWQAELIACADGCSLCGATLISNFWLITAAHCTDQPAIPSSSSVRLGHVTRGNGGVLHTLQQIINHPGWSGSLSDMNDIATLRTVTEIQFTDNIKPICLPTPDTCLQTLSEMWVSGYGKTAQDEGTAAHLQHVSLPLQTVSDCQSRFGSGVVDHTTTCGKLNGQRVCSGDSGGPFVYRQNNVWYHYGVVSFGGIDCDDVNNYSVYTRVTAFIEWITHNTGGEVSFTNHPENHIDGSTMCVDTGDGVSDVGAFEGGSGNSTWWENFGNSRIDHC